MSRFKATYKQHSNLLFRLLLVAGRMGNLTMRELNLLQSFGLKNFSDEKVRQIGAFIRMLFLNE